MGEFTTTEPPAFGFLGGAVVPLMELGRVARPGDVVAFGIDNEVLRQFGASNVGAASFLRAATAGLGGSRGWHDIGILRCADAEQSLQGVMVLAHHVAKQDMYPVLLACDHTASLGAALGVCRGVGVAPLYLYFDAHFDLGWHLPRPRLDNGNFVDELLRSDCVAGIVNVGARCASCGDECYRVSEQLCWQPVAPLEVMRAGLAAQLERHRERPLYVSIDADVLDPLSGVSACCHEPRGMSGDSLLELCRWLGGTGRVVGADLSELRPSPRVGPMDLLLGRCLRALFGGDSPAAEPQRLAEATV